MPRLVPSDVHVNKLLTNVGFRWKNLSYIADSIFPLVPVQNETDYYISWYKSVWFRDEAKKRAAGDPARRIGLNVKTDNQYTCEEYALAASIPTRVKNNADAAIRISSRVTELLTDKILLARERRVGTIVFDNSGSTWHETTLSGTGQWSDYANAVSDPIGDIDTGIASVEDNTGGLPANTMVLGIETWRKLKRHPDIMKYCFGLGSDRTTLVTPQKLATAFDLDRVLVGRGSYTSSAEGTAEASVSYTKIWGKHCWIGHVTPAPSILTPSAGYLFRANYEVRSWFDTESKADVIEASEIIDELNTSKDCGYLIINATA